MKQAIRIANDQRRGELRLVYHQEWITAHDRDDEGKEAILGGSWRQVAIPHLLLDLRGRIALP